MKHTRQLLALICTLLIGLSLNSTSFAASSNRIAFDMHEYHYIETSEIELELLSIANSDRALAGLSPLRLDAKLCAAAAVRMDEIAQRFSHTRPDGSSFSTVCDGAFAENIARGQRSAVRAMAAWMSSSGHRANILNARYSSIGICAREVRGIMYWVQLFGR